LKTTGAFDYRPDGQTGINQPLMSKMWLWRQGELPR
jgi:hypothetical protein